MNAIAYRWFCVKYWFRRLPEAFAWWAAYKLPRRVALFAFVRVYATLGECNSDYDRAYKAWERGDGR